MRVLKYEEGETLTELDGRQSIKLEVEVVESLAEGQKAGDVCFISFRVAGPGAKYGQERMKAFAMAACGYDDEDAYNAADPEGFGLDALTGRISPAFPEAADIRGRLVDVNTTRGNAKKDRASGEHTGEYYMNHNWSPVPEEEQEVPKPY